MPNESRLPREYGLFAAGVILGTLIQQYAPEFASPYAWVLVVLPIVVSDTVTVVSKWRGETDV